MDKIIKTGQTKTDIQLNNESDFLESVHQNHGAVTN